MERKLSKKEFVGIRKVLGFTQVEFGEQLGVSKFHIIRTEGNNDSYGYDVSDSLDKKVKNLLERMGVNIEDILEIIEKGEV